MVPGGGTSRTPPRDADDISRRSSGLWAVLAGHADFRRLFAGNSVSLFGSSVTTVALPLTAVTHLGASPAEMGVLGALAWLPHLVLGLPAGVWVDRLPYRRVLIVTDAAQLLLVGSIPALAVFRALSIWHLYVVAVLAGVAGLFASVAAQSFTPRLVPRDRLLAANSALMLSNATVGTTGSGIGGVLVAALGAPMAIVVDAASFLVSALCKTRIRTPGRVSAAGEPRPPMRLRSSIAEGWRAVFAHPVLRAVVVAATVGAFAGQVQAVVLVLYLVRDMSLSSGQIGALIAAGGLASVAGALMASRVTHRLGPGPTFILGMFLASVAGLVLAAAVGPFLVAFAVLVFAQCLRGLGPSLYGVNQQTLRQVLVPAELLARVNATWRFLAFGGQSLGALAGGVAGTAFGLRATLVAGSCLMLTGVAAGLLSPVRALRRLPSAQP
ncbi:MFS transporter [Sphaerisporangium melleum]|uniref:MFS transporter n=1 Tax=Sphaerisporangium melleum TaxID=321316 RepID=A0A917VKV3_9ACTN|nr:MFS transporter [Sphaerisporangium melleum]GGK94422.1 MFS transporter [Sphaerisporangium melleum]GII73241.1 MFS transporter [Sphaerisporangium melleum]